MQVHNRKVPRTLLFWLSAIIIYANVLRLGSRDDYEHLRVTPMRPILRK